MYGGGGGGPSSLSLTQFNVTKVLCGSKHVLQDGGPCKITQSDAS
jgi:hypothetical protein